jgi:hypothetical protein
VYATVGQSPHSPRKNFGHFGSIRPRRPGRGPHRPRPVTLPRPLPPQPRLPRLPAPLPLRPVAPRSVAAAVVGEPVVVVGEAVVVGAAAEAAVVARRWWPLRRPNTPRCRRAPARAGVCWTCPRRYRASGRYCRRYQRGSRRPLSGGVPCAQSACARALSVDAAKCYKRRNSQRYADSHRGSHKVRYSHSYGTPIQVCCDPKMQEKAK